MTMNLLIAYLTTTWTRLRQRRHQLRDDGYSTEAIAVIALLAVLALTVIGIITVKVIARANSIDLGTPTP
jgi:TctA family transporter